MSETECEACRASEERIKNNDLIVGGVIEGHHALLAELRERLKRNDEAFLIEQHARFLAVEAFEMCQKERDALKGDLISAQERFRVAEAENERLTEERKVAPSLLEGTTKGPSAECQKCKTYGVKSGEDAWKAHDDELTEFWRNEIAFLESRLAAAPDLAKILRRAINETKRHTRISDEDVPSWVRVAEALLKAEEGK